MPQSSWLSQARPLRGKVFIPNNSPPFPHQVAVFRASGRDERPERHGGQWLCVLRLARTADRRGGMRGAAERQRHLHPGRPSSRLTSRTETTPHSLDLGNRELSGRAPVTTTWSPTRSAAPRSSTARVATTRSRQRRGRQLADGGPATTSSTRAGSPATEPGSAAPAPTSSTSDLPRRQATLDGGRGDDTIVSQPAGGTATGGDGDDIIAIHGLIPQMSGAGFTVNGGDRRRHDHRRRVCRHDPRRRRPGLHRRPERRRRHRRLWLRNGCRPLRRDRYGCGGLRDSPRTVASQPGPFEM